jgi:hypothetical protein
MLEGFHRSDPARVANVTACMTFDGDSFRARLIDICVSHNQDASVLVERDPNNPSRRRFDQMYPIGHCVADLRLVAATLRLADILDFDRERTPAVLFHYLLPTSLRPRDDISQLEWGKHLTISNWHIDEDAIAFKGRCRSHIVHHAVVLFAEVIARELQNVHSTYSALGDGAAWPFALPTRTAVHIHEDGYRYVPYRFELDDERIYALLMGRAIYPTGLVAIRELLQNAVDACRLRDALTRLHEPHIAPDIRGRITIQYWDDKGGERPMVIVKDSGIGMDAYVLERWFLKVGRSYYDSGEFARIRAELRTANLDFAPVSEFGIGFLSVFLGADQVQVSTAAAEPLHGDLRKRTLTVDGPTRLMRLLEEANDGPGRFKGTEVTLLLRSDSEITWDKAHSYLEELAQDLPYVVLLEHHFDNDHIDSYEVHPRGLQIQLPPGTEATYLRVPLRDDEYGLEGEIALQNVFEAQKLEAEASGDVRVERQRPNSVLLRGGFAVCDVPGLPDSFVSPYCVVARARLNWETRRNWRFLRPSLGRQSLVNDADLARRVTRMWLTYLLDNVDSLRLGQILHLGFSGWTPETWLEQYGGRRVYKLARNGWAPWFKDVNQLAEWERGEGGALQIPPEYTVAGTLLRLILPNICRLAMGREAKLYAYPPVGNWMERLDDLMDFVSRKSLDCHFIDYLGSINELFVYAYPGSQWFNERYRETLDALPSNKERLFSLLCRLVEARTWNRPARLSADEIALLQEARATIGDLTIGNYAGQWAINSFRIV